MKLSLYKKAKKKKKKAPKHPETKVGGDARKEDTKEQEVTERQEISIIHTGGKRTRDEESI